MTDKNTALQIKPCRVCGNVPTISVYVPDKKSIRKDIYGIFGRGFIFDVLCDNLIAEETDGPRYSISCFHETHSSKARPIFILHRSSREKAIEDWNKEHDIELQRNPCRVCGERVDMWVSVDRNVDSATYGKEKYNILCMHLNLKPKDSVPDLYVIDCPTWEKAVEDWNKENPVKMRSASTIFTEEECANFHRKYALLRTRLEMILCNPESMLPNAEEYPHIRNRLKALMAMSYDELMDEIEADYILSGDYWGDYWR